MLCPFRLNDNRYWRRELASLPLCFVNLPNYITLTRIFSIPVLIWVLTSSYFNSTNGERELIAFVHLHRRLDYRCH